ncbi:hypothetical protein Ancab_003076 [Ancistrocladus abbreviatus]
MDEKPITNSRFKYVHETEKWPPEMVDIHHVAVARCSGLMSTVLWVSALLLLSNASHLLLGKERSLTILLWCIVLGAFSVRLLQRKLVVKESVVIMPAFGVQLETHYRRGRIVRRFVPINKILKPVLNECVTPVTCYWSLALILCEEDELMLVFKKLRPPLKMLIPIWKALCAATDFEDSLDANADIG